MYVQEIVEGGIFAGGGAVAVGGGPAGPSAADAALGAVVPIDEGEANRGADNNVRMGSWDILFVRVSACTLHKTRVATIWTGLSLIPMMARHMTLRMIFMEMAAILAVVTSVTVVEIKASVLYIAVCYESA